MNRMEIDVAAELDIRKDEKKIADLKVSELFEYYGIHKGFMMMCDPRRPGEEKAVLLTYRDKSLRLVVGVDRFELGVELKEPMHVVAYFNSVQGEVKPLIRDQVDKCTAVGIAAILKESADITRIARVAHEVNRAYCASLGDFSQRSWESAEQWQRDSAINGVVAILKNPDMTPEESHESWMAEKVATGWVYGEIKDPELKTHPCMVEYSKLPEAQRAKDHLFGATVKNLAKY